MKFASVWSAMLLAAFVAAAPQAQAAPAAAAPSTKACADRLAEVLTPTSHVPEQVDKLIWQLLDGLETQDPNFAGMARTYPGLKEALATSLRPVFLKNAQIGTPLYRADLSNLFETQLTAGECARATEFFVSSDGQALIEGLQSNMSLDRSMKSMVDQRQASKADLTADKGAAGVRTIASMDPAQRGRITAFFTSPLGTKLIALGPQRSAIDQKWFNYAPPGTEAEIKSVVLETMVGHVSKSNPEEGARFRKALEDAGLLPKKAG